KKETEHK
ncbi:hypothetical protein D047_0036B, partial [Vibrio parahaemolyticus VPTS-2010_2]